MLGAARPVDPGSERVHRSALRPLLHPGRNRRVTVDPGSHPIGIAEFRLHIVNAQACTADRLTNAILASLDLLVGVGVSAKQEVMATGLKGGSDHGLDLAVPAHDFKSRGSGCDPSGLHLKEAEPGRQKRSTRRTFGPGDPPVLTTVRSRDAARNVNSVLRQTVRLSLSTEQLSQERRECPIRQTRDVLSGHLLGENVAGRSGRRLSARQGRQSTRVCFKHAQQPDHRGPGPDGSGLVLCEGARATTEELPGI